jgi:hypothetical protein
MDNVAAASRQQKVDQLISEAEKKAMNLKTTMFSQLQTLRDENQRLKVRPNNFARMITQYEIFRRLLSYYRQKMNRNKKNHQLQFPQMILKNSNISWLGR